MRTRFAQLTMAFIALIIGLALVAQFRSQALPTELTSLPVAELSTRIQTLSEGNAQLRAALPTSETCWPNTRPRAPRAPVRSTSAARS